MSTLLPSATDLSKALVVVRRGGKPEFLTELQPNQSIVRNGQICVLPPLVRWGPLPEICFWEMRSAQRVVTWLYQTRIISPHEPLFIESLLRHLDPPREAATLEEAAAILGADPATPPMPVIPREPETLEEALRMLEADPNTPKLPAEFRHDPT
jgi:hypothetical protein